MIIILEYSFFRISEYTCCFQGLNLFVAAAAAAAALNLSQGCSAVHEKYIRSFRDSHYTLRLEYLGNGPIKLAQWEMIERQIKDS